MRAAGATRTGRDQTRGRGAGVAVGVLPRLDGTRRPATARTTADLLGPPRPPEVRVLVSTVLLAGLAALAVGLLPVWTALALACGTGLVLVRRLDLAALMIIAVLPPVRALDDLGVDPVPLDLRGVEVGALVVLLAAWVLDGSRVGAGAAPRSSWWRLHDGWEGWDQWDGQRLLRPVLVAVAVVAAVVVVVRHDGTAPLLEQLLAATAPAVVALALLTAMQGRLTPRRLGGVHVGVALVIALLTALTVLLGGAPTTYDASRVAFWAVGAVPLVLALGVRRRTVPSLVAVAVLLGAVVLQVAVGATSPAVLLGVGAALLVAGATGQLGVRTMTAVVALALVAVGTVPVLARGLDPSLTTSTLAARAIGVGGPLELAVPLVVTATAFVAAWPAWSLRRDRLAGAVCSAVVGTGVTVALAGGTGSLALWVLAALAGAVGGGPRSAGPGR